jgi:hypothetical protein
MGRGQRNRTKASDFAGFRSGTDELVFVLVYWQRKGMTSRPCLSEEEKKRGGGKGEGCGLGCCGLLLLGPGVGPVGLPVPLFLFKLFSIFCFFNSSITFAIELQMTSNQLLKFSKIQISPFKQ